MAIDQDAIDLFQPLIDTLNKKVAALESVSGSPVDLTEIENSINTLNVSVMELSDNVNSLVGRVDTLEDAQGSPIDIVELENRIGAVESAIETIVHPNEIIEVYQPEGQEEVRVTYHKVS